MYQKGKIISSLPQALSSLEMERLALLLALLTLGDVFYLYYLFPIDFETWLPHQDMFCFLKKKRVFFVYQPHTPGLAQNGDRSYQCKDSNPIFVVLEGPHRSVGKTRNPMHLNRHLDYIFARTALKELPGLCKRGGCQRGVTVPLESFRLAWWAGDQSIWRR